MPTPQLTVKQGDTYPSWVVAVSEGGAWLDISSATTLTLRIKAQDAANAISGACTALSTSTITANLTAESPTLTGVSSFANIKIGTTLVGADIPEGTSVEDFDSGLGTITMSANANASATGASITVGMGEMSYVPTGTAPAGAYSAEVAIEWSSGQLQTIPNAQEDNGVIQIDPIL